MLHENCQMLVFDIRCLSIITLPWVQKLHLLGCYHQHLLPKQDYRTQNDKHWCVTPMRPFCCSDHELAYSPIDARDTTCGDCNQAQRF